MCEVPERGPDCRPRGVDPGDQHQIACAEHEDVVDWLSIDLEAEQVADQIVIARVRSPILDLLHEEGDDLHPALQGDFAIDQTGLEDTSHPVDEVVLHLERDAEDHRNHANRNALCVVRRGVCGAVVDESVDQPVAQVAGDRLVLGDRLRCERGKDRTPVPVVLRWIRIDRWDPDATVGPLSRLWRTLDHADLPRREDLWRLRHCDDMGVTSRHPGAAVLIAVRDRPEATCARGGQILHAYCIVSSIPTVVGLRSCIGGGR